MVDKNYVHNAHLRERVAAQVELPQRREGGEARVQVRQPGTARHVSQLVTRGRCNAQTSRKAQGLPYRTIEAKATD